MLLRSLVARLLILPMRFDSFDSSFFGVVAEVDATLALCEGCCAFLPFDPFLTAAVDGWDPVAVALPFGLSDSSSESTTVAVSLSAGVGAGVLSFVSSFIRMRSECSKTSSVRMLSTRMSTRVEMKM